MSPRHGASSGCGRRNGLKILWVTANILQEKKAVEDSIQRGGSPTWGLGVVLTTPQRKSSRCYEIFHSDLTLYAPCIVL